MSQPGSLLLFNAQPDAILLLSPEWIMPEWIILGASDDYLAATLTERDVLVGQHIFDAFPDTWRRCRACPSPATLPSP